MAAEADNPKTGLIAWVTAISLILILVVFIVLQGLFFLWDARHRSKMSEGSLASPLTQYRQEQELKLNTIQDAKKQTLADAIAGKVLATPPPPAAPTKTENQAPVK
jgi:flagellar basal body-associated protein FliL